MAGAGLFALLDDIATLLDDVSILTKVAAKKTAGVLGDDLALNAQQVTGVSAARELPVVWAVAKGSLLNKAILVPAALAISAWLPWAITPLMMLGGAFLCYEGVEKLAHKFLHGKEDAQRHTERIQALADAEVDMVAWEKDKVRGAIRTDFILSAEIIVLSLGVVAHVPFLQRVLVLAAIALAMTVFVYGLVAGIVKLDDIGLWLLRRRPCRRRAGPRHPARHAVVDAWPVDRRHRGDVPGGRRHSRTRDTGTAPLGGGLDSVTVLGDRGQRAGQRGGRHPGWRAGAGGGERGATPAERQVGALSLTYPAR